MQVKKGKYLFVIDWMSSLNVKIVTCAQMHYKSFSSIVKWQPKIWHFNIFNSWDIIILRKLGRRIRKTSLDKLWVSSSEVEITSNYWHELKQETSLFLAWW